MASISFDKSTGWWSIKFFAGPARGRVKRSLCKHPFPWTPARPPRRPPAPVDQLAAPYIEAERLARLGVEASVGRATPLRPYLEAYLARIALTHAANTVEAVRVACRKFAAYCEGRKLTTLEAVTYAVCRDWVAARLAEGGKRSTVVTERSNLRPVWTGALTERRVAENPWELARVPGKGRAEAPTAWTAEEAGRLVGAVGDGWLKDLVRVGLNTGVRIGALLELRWEQVDWAAGLIRVRAATSKSGRAYEVPITPTCNSVLAARQHGAARGATRGYVFLNPATGRPYNSRTTFTRIGRAVAQAGIPDHGDYNHCLRRSFATLALNSGIPLEVVSRCLDHATLAQTQRAYCHILNRRLIEGMAGFDVGG